jgi:hypothetical protein
MESARIMPSNPASEVLSSPRTRSFGFFEFDGLRWGCYLMTYRTAQRRWCGYLTFRPDQANSLAEVRTADLFIEAEEAEIERRARSMGRPLLSGLLASALEVESRPTGARLRGWVKDALEQERGQDAGDEVPLRAAGAEAWLRSEYATYRLDQVTHLVGLISEDVFESVVGSLLEKESYSFRSQDRLQFAMLFVQKLEPLLPLPPFEMFAADLLAHRSEYSRYHHELHSGDGVSGL